MTGASLLVAALENEGGERIFGVAGEENLAFVESLRRFRPASANALVVLIIEDGGYGMILLHDDE